MQPFMSPSSIEWAVYAALHVAVVDRVYRHTADTMIEHLAAGIFHDLVACDAVEVGAVGTHVYVELTRGVEQCHGDVAVFDVVAAACVRVAERAVLVGWNAVIQRHAAGDDVQIDTRIRHASRRFAFLVCSGLIVANQAVH
jgi:hypothetical protein